VAGAFFGTLGVFVDALSDLAGRAGLHAILGSARGLALLGGILLLGGGGILLTQISFQVGTLAATLPASLATDPLTGVLLGAVLLHERIPLSAPHLAGYSICYLAALFGVARLATLSDREHRVGSAEVEITGRDGS
jgi:hypothetical protein